MRIIITDLTRFRDQDTVCIAGLSPDTRICIRPLPYLLKSKCRQLNILPGAILDGRFRRRHSSPPHVEDHSYSDLRFCGLCSSECFHDILAESSVQTITGGFSVTIPEGQKHIPPDMAPQISIITVPVDPRDIQIVQDTYNSSKLKAHLTDGSGREFRYMSITDLGFYEYAMQQASDRMALRRLNDFIHGQEEAYVRVGLSREYESPDGRRGFWMQVNGIYTFPDFFEQIRCYGRME